MTISKSEFLTPLPTKIEEVPLPEFGEGKSIKVHGMTARERAMWERQFQKADGTPRVARYQEFRERLLIACCRDDSGAPMFTLEDIVALSQQQVNVVDRIVNAAKSMCGISDDDEADLVGN